MEKRGISRLKALSEIASIDITPDFDEVLGNILKIACEAMDADSGIILLVDEKTDELRISASYGLLHCHIERVYKAATEMEQSISERSGTVLETGKQYSLANINDNERWYDLPGEFELSSQVFIPLKIGSQVIGSLNVYKVQSHHFTEEDIDFINVAAAHVSLLVHNARINRILEDKIRKARESERILGTIVDNIADGVLLMDVENKRFHPGNKMICQMLGRDPHEISNMGIDDFFPGKEAERWNKILQAVAKKGKQISRDHVMKLKKGNRIPVRVSASVVKLNGKKIIQCIFRDITEHKKAKELHLENMHLKYANKVKSEFFANMSHELRTPLTLIIGFSEILKKRMWGELNENQERYIDNILTSSKFLLKLINDALDLCKTEAGKMNLIIEKVSVPEVIDETLTLMKEQAARNKIILKKEIDPDLDFIEADEQRLKQILFNFLSNAVKFNNKVGGVVTVAVEKEGSMARFSISDTGIGIRKKDMGKLFKKFKRLDCGSAKQYEGTGLGLVISRQFVELHGGKIMVESKYGKGSTFTFFLPLKAKKKGN